MQNYGNLIDSDSDDDCYDHKVDNTPNNLKPSYQNKRNENETEAIPRPKQSADIYINKEGKTIFQTDPEENNVPHCLSYYTCEETVNSSPRLIRSTINKLPIEQKMLNESKLIFGMYFQPFAEIRRKEKEIPVVQIEGNDILRCKRCKAFVNRNFQFKHSKDGVNHVFLCNLCKYENEITLSTEGFKNNYFKLGKDDCEELLCPTVDFVANSKYIEKDICPRYVFLIDYSVLSINIGYINYILNSIHTVFSNNSFENEMISFVLIDEEKVYYFKFDKEIKILVVDAEDPFVPCFPNNLFFKGNQANLENFIDKLNNIIFNKFHVGKQKNNIKKIKLGNALRTCVEILKEFGGRIFTFCTTDIEIPSKKEKNKGDNDDFEQNNWMYLENIGTENEKELYSTKNEFLTDLVKICVKNFIVVDSFFFSNFLIDMAAFVPICNMTSGALFLYQLDIDHEGKTNSCSKEYKFNIEKLFYDFSRIITRRNLYQVGFKLRSSNEIDILEFIGQFGSIKKVTSFEIPGCNSDFNFSAIFKINKNLTPGQEIYFQLASIYTDIHNRRFIRILNYKMIACSDLDLIYKNVDNCALTKLTLIKSILAMKETSLKEARKGIENILIDLLFYYRKMTAPDTSESQLIIPDNVKFYPLYLNAFFKKPLFQKIKSETNITELIYLMHKFLREPIHLTLKYIYPRMYRLDNIPTLNNYVFHEDKEYDKHQKTMIRGIGSYYEKEKVIIKPLIIPLSYDYIDMDNALLLDDGECLYLFVFFDIEIRFLSDIFNVNSFPQLVTLDPENIETNEMDLNIRLHNIINQIRKDNLGYTQPLVIITVNEEEYKKEFLMQFLVEDYFKSEQKYFSFLVDIHEQILRKMKGKR